MGLFEIILIGLGLLGLGGIGVLLVPLLSRGREPDPESASELPDAAAWAKALRIPLSPDDDPTPWIDKRPMLPEGRRLPDEIKPCERLPIVIGCGLVPLASALLEVDSEAEALQGRHQGRAFHLVRLSAGVYLDLIEAIRVVPVFGVEADARELSLEKVILYDSLDAAREDHGEDIGVVAPWLMGLEGPRVVPEGEGVRRWRLSFEAGQLEVEAWMPAVAEGIRQDRLRWAGIARWQGVVEAGATSRAVLAHLVEDPSAFPKASDAWGWTRSELAEAIAVGFHLDGEGVEVTAFADEVFADRTLPVPASEEEALVVAAALNWRGVIARRAGQLESAIAVFDGALEVAGSGDDDTRADLHYNRGMARLQLLLHHEVELEEQSLATVLEDFAEATRLNPMDGDTWSQRAMLHQLAGHTPIAADCWLQAATQTRDLELQQTLMANAEALR